MKKDDFLNEKVICGYKVDTDRKKIWKTQIDMLLFVQRVCDKYGIEYFMHSGSALGAVRHKGYIPWDDDLDLGMLRKDFDAFLEVAPREVKNPMFIQYGLNDGGHVCGLIRVRNSDTTGIIRIDKNKNCNNGIFIEIYPFDNVPKNAVVRGIQHFCSLTMYHSLLADYYGPQSKKQEIGLILVKIFGKEKIHTWWQKICKWSESKKTEYVDTVALPDYFSEGIYRFKRQWVEDTKDVPYEYITAKIPSGVEQILKQNYGDYMELPKEEDRGMLHRNTIFFDPNIPYKEYQDSLVVDKYFDNESI